MKQELIQVVENLINDKYFAVTVSSIDDVGNENAIEINATNDFLVQKYGSAVEFFDTIYKNGSKKIKVYPRKQNGTDASKNKINYKPATKIQPFEVEFEPKVEAEKQPVQQLPERVVHTAVPLSSPVGLGYAEIYKIQDYDKVVRDLERYKAERNQLRDDKIRLERQIFEQETLGTKSAEKAKAQAEMLNSPIATTIVQLLATKLIPVAGETVGLGQAENLSPIKQKFLKLDDTYLQDLYKVAELMQNQEFDAKLMELLQQYSNQN